MFPPGEKILRVRQEILNTTNNLPRLESGSRSRTSQVTEVHRRRARGHAGGPRPICTGPPARSPSDFSSSCRCPGGVACCPDGFCCWRMSSAGHGGQSCGGSVTSWSEERTHTGRAFQNSPPGHTLSHKLFSGQPQLICLVLRYSFTGNP